MERSLALFVEGVELLMGVISRNIPVDGASK